MADILDFDDNAVSRAVEVLARGGLVAIPTETVYGLAADAAHGEGVAGIFAAKGRPQFNPLIAHVDSIAMAERYVTFDAVSRKLAETFWPGPLTLVLPLKVKQDTRRPIHPLVTAGLETLAIRMPTGKVRDVIKISTVRLQHQAPIRQAASARLRPKLWRTIWVTRLT